MENSLNLNGQYITPNIYFRGTVINTLGELSVEAMEGNLAYCKSLKQFYVFCDFKWNLLASVKNNALCYYNDNLYERFKLYLPLKKTLYNNVPLVYGIFGFEVQIGTKYESETEVFYARTYEVGDRLENNFKNFIYFFRNYLYALSLDLDKKRQIYKFGDYKIIYKRKRICSVDLHVFIMSKKSRLLYKSFAVVVTKNEIMAKSAFDEIKSIGFNDKDIPLMKELTELIYNEWEALKKIELEAKEKRESEKEAKKIFYDLVGI